MIVTFDTGILVRATKRSRGPARRAVDAVINNPQRSVARIVQPSAGIPIVLSDPADDPIIYTALAGEAAAICEIDRHFYDARVTSFCEAQGILVMSDVALLKFLG